jgi:transposase
MAADNMAQADTISLRTGDYQKLLAQIEQLKAQVEKLSQENAELKRRLGLNSTNSSKPPSSDPPSVVRSFKDPTGRKPGKQKGTKGSRRQMLEPTQVIEHRPDVCSHCGANIPSDTPNCSYQYRQQVEIPPIEPIVTEYHYHRVGCLKCGKTTKAQMMEEEKPCCGPRLSALIAMLTTVYNLPRRHVERLLETVLGVKLSLGTIDNRIQEMGDALEGPASELERQLAKEQKLNIDETGWKKAGQRLWLWVFVATSFTFFRITASRGKKVLSGVLGEKFLGYIISDSYSSYRSYQEGSRWQVCLSHLIRKAKELSESEDSEVRGFGCRVRRELKLMIGLWKRKRCDSVEMNWCKARLKRGCELNKESKQIEVRRLARRILKDWESVVLFTAVEGICPTNNIAERSLRSLVIARKISFGNHSERGLVSTERLRSVVATCKMRGMNVWNYLTHVLTQYRVGLPVSSLLQNELSG